MIIKSLKTHFPARAIEWLMAGVLFTWGYYTITHPQMFTAPGSAHLFSGIGRVSQFFGQPPVAIGVLAMVTGIVRAAALFINGTMTKTPLVRLVTAFISAYLWTSIAIGFWISDVANTGLAVYPWFVFADVVSSYRAGYDLVIAENNARKLGSPRDDYRLTGSGFGRLLDRLDGRADEPVA